MKILLGRLGLLLILSVTCSCLAFPQGRNKLYTSIMADKGMLYYIKPQKMIELKGDSKAIICDYTYLDSHQDVRMLFTIYTSSPLELDTAQWVDAEGKSYQYALEYIYRNPKGKSWENRVELKLPYQQWQKLFSDTRSPRFVLLVAEDKTLEYVYKENYWQKYLPLYKQFIQSVKLNRSQTENN